MGARCFEEKTMGDPLTSSPSPSQRSSKLEDIKPNRGKSWEAWGLTFKASLHFLLTVGPWVA